MAPITCKASNTCAAASIALNEISAESGSEIRIEGNTLTGARNTRIDARHFAFAPRDPLDTKPQGLLRIADNNISTTLSVYSELAKTHAVLLNRNFKEGYTNADALTPYPHAEGGRVVVEDNFFSGFPVALNVAWPPTGLTVAPTTPHTFYCSRNVFQGNLTTAVVFNSSRFYLPDTMARFAYNTFTVSRIAQTGFLLHYPQGLNITGGHFHVAGNMGVLSEALATALGMPVPGDETAGGEEEEEELGEPVEKAGNSANAAVMAELAKGALRMVSVSELFPLSTEGADVAFCNNSIAGAILESDVDLFRFSSMGNRQGGIVSRFCFRCGCGEFGREGQESPWCGKRPQCCTFTASKRMQAQCTRLATRKTPFPMMWGLRVPQQ